MKIILEYLSTRELAITIWLLLLFLSLKKEVRGSFSSIGKLFFTTILFPVFAALTVYVATLIMLLKLIGLWNVYLLKDSVLWFVTVAIVLFARANQMKDNQYFIEVMKDCFKWGVLWDFMANFYTLSLTKELILVPFIVLMTLVKAVADNDSKYLTIRPFLDSLMKLLGLLLIGFVFYKTFFHWQELFQFNNFLSLILTPILTILLIPFIYCLVLFINYETLFINIDFLTNLDRLKKPLKWLILIEAKLSLTKLMNIKNNLHKKNLRETDNLGLYIRQIAKHNYSSEKE